MYYSRIEESGNGLILRRSSSIKIYYWLILVFGIICLLPGLLLIFDPETGITANFVLGFGLVFCAGALLLNDMRKKIPEKIEFFNQEQLVKVSGHRKEHLFNYSEIDHIFKRTTRDGSTMSVLKKDGSVWDLMSSNSRRGAQKNLSLLREKIKLTSQITPELQYLLPDSFQKYENAG